MMDLLYASYMGGGGGGGGDIGTYKDTSLKMNRELSYLSQSRSDMLTYGICNCMSLREIYYHS